MWPTEQFKYFFSSATVDLFEYFVNFSGYRYFILYNTGLPSAREDTVIYPGTYVLPLSWTMLNILKHDVCLYSLMMATRISRNMLQ
jgi:hypothetical protein